MSIYILCFYISAFYVLTHSLRHRIIIPLPHTKAFNYQSIYIKIQLPYLSQPVFSFITCLLFSAKNLTVIHTQQLLHRTRFFISAFVCTVFFNASVDRYSSAIGMKYLRKGRKDLLLLSFRSFRPQRIRAYGGTVCRNGSIQQRSAV